jgi:toxin ParE1/3/4
MPKPIITTEEAIFDIAEQAAFIAEENPNAADRYISVVRETIASLCDKPTRGSLYKTGNPKPKGLRRLIVPGFKNYLVFHPEEPRKIRVIRVLHGARDINTILVEE